MGLQNIRKLSRGAAMIGAMIVLTFASNANVFAFNESRITEPELFTKCWNYSSQPDISFTPVADDLRVYFLNVDNKLEAVDLSNATKVWSTEVGGELISNLLAHDGSLFVVSSVAQNGEGGTGRTVLRSLSKQTGVTNWSVVISAATRVTQGITNTHVVLVDAAGSIRAFDPADGDLVWSRDLGANVSGDPLFHSDELTIATGKKEIIVISGHDGQTRLAVKTRQVPTAVLPDSSNRFLIGDERGNLTLTSRDGKRIWKFRNGAKISFLMSYDSEFLAASFDNFIYKISRSGNVEWKRRLSGRAASRPVISGDTAVVSIVGDDSIYFIDLKDGKISNRVGVSDGDIGGVATGVGKANLVLSGTRGVALYSSEGCTGK